MHVVDSIKLASVSEKTVVNETVTDDDNNSSSVVRDDITIIPAYEIVFKSLDNNAMSSFIVYEKKTKRGCSYQLGDNYEVKLAKV